MECEMVDGKEEGDLQYHIFWFLEEIVGAKER